MTEVADFDQFLKIFSTKGVEKMEGARLQGLSGVPRSR